MGSRRPKADPRRTERSSSPQTSQTHRNRFGILVATAVAIALAIVLVIAELTPLKDVPPEKTVALEEPFESPIAALPTIPVEATIEGLQEEARETARALLRRFPKSSEAHQIMALLHKANRQTDDAAAFWRKALELAPKDPRARVGLAQVCMDQGDDRAAVEALDEAIALGCASPEISHALATALTRLSEIDRAAEVLRSNLTAFPQSSKNWLLLGQIQFQQDALQEAEASLKKAIALAPESTNAYYALASVCTRQGNREAAFAYRKRFAELKAHDRRQEDRIALVADLELIRQRTAATLCGASSVWLRNGDPAEAERLARRAIEIAPGIPEPYKVLASLCQQQGRLAEAILVLRRLANIDPKNVASHLNLANLYVRSGELRLAEETLQQAIQLQPDAGIAYECYAKLCMETGSLQKARTLAEEWLRLTPSPEGYLLLADACRQLGDIAAADDAVNEMGKLQSRPPRQPSAGSPQVRSR